MKESQTILERQNDETALKLLKASTKCFTMERVIKYFMIVLSFLICLAAILNRYLGVIIKWTSEVDEGSITAVQDSASTYINLISGAIIVIGIVMGFYVTRMHNEGCALQDRYEAYVFKNPANKSILRPVSQSYIDRYAQVSQKNEPKYLNHIYPESKKNLNESTAQYEYIKKEVKHDYDMYIFIQPFFLTIWIGFCVLIIVMAVSFNDDFITTLINILIPSLSAITTISTSWYNNRIQMKQLNNLLNCIERIENLSDEKKRQYITDPKLVRQLADGLFNYRASPFVIPIFLQKLHNVQLQKKQLSNLTNVTVNKDTKAINSNNYTKIDNNTSSNKFKVGSSTNEISKQNLKNNSTKTTASKQTTEVKKPVQQQTKTSEKDTRQTQDLTKTSTVSKQKNTTNKTTTAIKTTTPKKSKK